MRFNFLEHVSGTRNYGHETCSMVSDIKYLLVEDLQLGQHLDTCEVPYNCTPVT